jgi:hypothetical protein
VRFEVFDSGLPTWRYYDIGQHDVRANRLVASGWSLIGAKFVKLHHRSVCWPFRATKRKEEEESETLRNADREFVDVCAATWIVEDQGSCPAGDLWIEHVI